MDTNIFTLDEILVGFRAKWTEVIETVKLATEEQWAPNGSGVWSIGEEFEHVVLSARPVASGLKVPKLVLRSFGKPNREVRNYAELYARYQVKLGEGGTAPANFQAKPGEMRTREEMLDEWKKILEKFESRLPGKWSEKDLDSFLVPHPLLGKIMVRELLMFTHFHTDHHLQSMKRKLGQAT